MRHAEQWVSGHVRAVLGLVPALGEAWGPSNRTGRAGCAGGPALPGTPRHGLRRGEATQDKLIGLDAPHSPRLDARRGARLPGM